MNNSLKEFSKQISDEYLHYNEGEIIIIPFKEKASAESCLNDISIEHYELFFSLRQVSDGWDVVVAENKCKHEHLIDVERMKGGRYGPQCKDCGEFVMC